MGKALCNLALVSRETWLTLAASNDVVLGSEDSGEFVQIFSAEHQDVAEFAELTEQYRTKVTVLTARFPKSCGSNSRTPEKIPRTNRIL